MSTEPTRYSAQASDAVYRLKYDHAHKRQPTTLISLSSTQKPMLDPISPVGLAVAAVLCKEISGGERSATDKKKASFGESKSRARKLDSNPPAQFTEAFLRRLYSPEIDERPSSIKDTAPGTLRMGYLY
ncbi:hypothetical protein PG994_009609 [Apiospora phragmitis]|uniref:Uncharacterized protein n=1 Tax=Apiospora phragmitis TaxID=2905665 RepID=A0ABR1U6N5_9PEZI